MSVTQVLPVSPWQWGRCLGDTHHDQGLSSSRPRASQTWNRTPQSPTASMNPWVSSHAGAPSHAHSPARVPACICVSLATLGSAPPPQTRRVWEGPRGPRPPPTSISHSSRERRIGSLCPPVPPGHIDPSLGHSSSVSWSLADKPNPRSRQAEDEDDGVALLVPGSSEWIPSAETRGLWGGSGGSGWGG